jgi:hypothetical protein
MFDARSPAMLMAWASILELRRAAEAPEPPRCVEGFDLADAERTDRLIIGQLL